MRYGIELYVILLHRTLIIPLFLITYMLICLSLIHYVKCLIVVWSDVSLRCVEAGK